MADTSERTGKQKLFGLTGFVQRKLDARRTGIECQNFIRCLHTLLLSV